MRLISQQKPGDCDVACIAMLTGITYAAAWAASLPFMRTPLGHIPFERLGDIFASLGFSATLIPAGLGESHADGLCEITYIRDDALVTHNIVWDSARQTFLDPQRTPPEHFTIVRFLEVRVRKNQGSLGGTGS